MPRPLAGIPGGFAPPVPNQIITITAAAQDSPLRVSSAVRPDGARTLQDAYAPKLIPTSDAHTTSLIEELADILQGIPDKAPPGIPDFYGFDTAIVFEGQGWRWSNKIDKSCTGSGGGNFATDEQKAKFKRVIKIVKELEKKEA